MNLLWHCVRPLLFAMNPEKAHRLAMQALKMGLVCGQKFEDNRLGVHLAGLVFSNPLGLAAGFDKNGEAASALLRLGFGHVEIGTVTPRPQQGNPLPRLFRLNQDGALINRMGFNNHGHDVLLSRLRLHKRAGVVGLNIGANKDSDDRIADYTAAIERFYDYVDYFTVNISSPNTPGLRDLQEREHLEILLTKLQAVRKIKKKVPIFLKIAPDLSEPQLDDVARAVLDKECDGLVISNTTLSRESLVNQQMHEAGGVSGRPLFDRATLILAKMRHRVGGKLPIIGVGGITNGKDALEKIRAGADLIQIYSVMIFAGPGIAVQILRELAHFCERDGVDSIGEYRDQHTTKWASRPLN